MTKKQLRPSVLVEDFDIYPRTTVDTVAINRYAESLRQGATLPPPIVDKATNRIVDGLHRTRAHKKVTGDEPITVDVVAFASEAEMIEQAVRLNVTHGRALGTQDIVRVYRMLTNLGYLPADVADAIQISEVNLDKTVLKLTAHVAASTSRTTQSESTLMTTGGKKKKKKREVPEVTTTAISLKPALRHLAGTDLTKEQAAVNQYLAGSSQTYLFRQVRLIVAAGLVDEGSDEGRLELAMLRDALIDLSWLPETVPE